jgi:hypothetical protein
MQLPVVSEVLIRELLPTLNDQECVIGLAKPLKERQPSLGDLVFTAVVDSVDPSESLQASVAVYELLKAAHSPLPLPVIQEKQVGHILEEMAVAEAGWAGSHLQRLEVQNAALVTFIRSSMASSRSAAAVAFAAVRVIRAFELWPE